MMVLPRNLQSHGKQERRRIVFAGDVADSGGSHDEHPQITVNEYAAIEVGALWVNDCAGQSQVIACSNGQRTLENITIDGGLF